MAHGLNSVLKRAPGALASKNEGGGKTGIGSRRIFPPHFKLQVLDSYRNDTDCKGNQRATARKYGIHRRQIQKWLQVENNLRNSVGKSKSGEQCVANPEQARKCVTELALRTAGLRQRDDLCADACSQSADVRVPAVTPDAYSEMLWPENKDASHQTTQAVSVPLDFTTHSRSHASPVAASPVPSTCDPAVPMDLSLKTLTSVPPGHHRAPVYRSPSPPTTNSVIRVSSPRAASPTNTILGDVWDLSTKSQKRKHEESPLHSPELISTTPKPVKLFKPYLDDLHDNSNSSEDFHSKTSETPCCSSYAFSGYGCEQACCNNNVCDVKAEYTYTLHELQPRSSIGYFYPVTNSTGPCYMYPGSDCESLYYSYEDPTLFQSAHLKQRQSYSLEFKLSAIECYYRDEFCRGNQRAVASKYNIHRRQVQKWLKQEDELRQRNETIKQIHAVS